MPEVRKRSSRRLASEKWSLRGWLLRHRVVLRGVIWAAKVLLHIWGIWHQFRDDLWPFYLRITGCINATRGTSFGAGVSRHEPDDFGRTTANFKVLPVGDREWQEASEVGVAAKVRGHIWHPSILVAILC